MKRKLLMILPQLAALLLLIVLSVGVPLLAAPNVALAGGYQDCTPDDSKGGPFGETDISYLESSFWEDQGKYWEKLFYNNFMVTGKGNSTIAWTQPLFCVKDLTNNVAVEHWQGPWCPNGVGCEAYNPPY